MTAKRIFTVQAVYYTLTLVMCVVLYVVTPGRTTHAPPIGVCTDNPSDCPIRTFCYRALPGESWEDNFYGESLKNATSLTDTGGDLDGPTDTVVNLWGDDGADMPDEIPQVCACYGMFGETGLQPIPGATEFPLVDGVEASEYCEDSEGYKGLLTILIVILIVEELIIVGNMYKAQWQMYQVKALTWNAGGITLTLISMASLLQATLLFVYLLEITGSVSPVYSVLDGVRPMVFGFFAVAQIGALLEVSLMWADVYSKSVKMGAQDNTIANLTKLVGSLIVMTFVIVMGGLLLGKSTIAAGWIILLLISVAGAYFRGGSQLARILAPANPDAPGADSAKAASDEIKTTAVYIPIYNVGFFFGLVGYSITVQRPLTGPVSFICVTTFLQCASFHQMRLLYYCRFGARKKLAKAGYKGFRSSLMSTMSSSSVEPEDSDSRGK